MLRKVESMKKKKKNSGKSVLDLFYGFGKVKTSIEETLRDQFVLYTVLYTDRDVLVVISSEFLRTDKWYSKIHFDVGP